MVDPVEEYIRDHPLEEMEETGTEDVPAGEEELPEGQSPLSDDELMRAVLPKRAAQGSEAEESASESPDHREEESTEAPKAQPEESKGDENESKEDDVLRKAREWESFEERWARDPASVVKALINALSDDQKQTILGTSSTEDASSSEEGENLVPISDVEQDYVSFKPQVVEANRQIVEYITGQAQIITDLMVDLEILQAKLEGLTEYNAFKMPDADREQVKREVLSGKKSSYREAVKKSAVANRQASRPRPTTPSGSSAGMSVSRGESMSSIFAKLAGSPPR